MYVTADEAFCITPDALAWYEALQNKLKDVENSYKTIVTDINVGSIVFNNLNSNLFKL